MKNLNKSIYCPKLLLILSFYSVFFAGCAGIQAKPGAVLGNVPSQGPVGKTIKSNAHKFENCAGDSVSVQTGSIQNLELLFTIDKEGKVLRASIEKMSEPDPDLYVCVLKVLKKIKFPEPGDKKHKVLHYPLQLKPNS